MDESDDLVPENSENAFKRVLGAKKREIAKNAHAAVQGDRPASRLFSMNARDTRKPLPSPPYRVYVKTSVWGGLSAGSRPLGGSCFQHHEPARSRLPAGSPPHSFHTDSNCRGSIWDVLWGGRPRPRRTPWSGSAESTQKAGRRGRRPRSRGDRPTSRTSDS